MKKLSSETHNAAKLLGKRGGIATLKKYGRDKLRQWGRLGAEFGKLGGRPPKHKKAAKSHTRQSRTGASE